MATLSFISPPSSSLHHPRYGATATTRLILTSPSLNLRTTSSNFCTIKAFLSPSLSSPFTEDDLKKLATDKSVEYVSRGMVLGTGSTAAFVVDKLDELLKIGQLKDIVGIPTSKRTQQQDSSLGIHLSILDDHPKLDLTIDDADEVDLDLNLVNGRGGAIREKMEAASRSLFFVN